MLRNSNELTTEELRTIEELVEFNMDRKYGEIMDIHDLGEEVPDYMMQDYNRYVDLWNKIGVIMMRTRK